MPLLPRDYYALIQHSIAKTQQNGADSVPISSITTRMSLQATGDTTTTHSLNYHNPDFATICILDKYCAAEVYSNHETSLKVSS